MRLDKLTIGSPKDSPTHHFKNLKNITVDFDQDHWITVVIGWNGTGKSNVLEALAIIFRDLIQGDRKPSFAFNLTYRVGSGADTSYINIDADPDRDREALVIYVGSEAEAKAQAQAAAASDLFPAVPTTSPEPIGAKVALKWFFENPQLLPRYVFAYYSGESDRLFQVFRPYLERFDAQLRLGRDPGLKRLFYALPVHSHFVLLAFLIQQSEDVRQFLSEHLGIDPDQGIESVLFVLREPPWDSHEGDSRFWNAKGVVAGFLDRLYSIALAPIEVSRRVEVSLWNKRSLTFKYLFVKDIIALRALVGDQRPAEFFRDMESTHVSQLIEEVRIRVRLKKNDGTVTFRELSEGEQQLLTVLGLLRFTAESESLFLLDEPDTHLNPQWSVDYLNYLRTFAGATDDDRRNSHILLTTHNPLAIAELVKEQVQVLQRDVEHQVIAAKPDQSPRGMGYAGILTSDMFGLQTTLDQPTEDLVRDRRALTEKTDLNEADIVALKRIDEKLDALGFSTAHWDSDYQAYLQRRKVVASQLFDQPVDPEIEARRRQVADELIKSILQEEATEAGEISP